MSVSAHVLTEQQQIESQTPLCVSIYITQHKNTHIYLQDERGIFNMSSWICWFSWSVCPPQCSCRTCWGSFQTYQLSSASSWNTADKARIIQAARRKQSLFTVTFLLWYLSTSLPQSWRNASVHVKQCLREMGIPFRYDVPGCPQDQAEWSGEIF